MSSLNQLCCRTFWHDGRRRDDFVSFSFPLPILRPRAHRVLHHHPRLPLSLTEAPRLHLQDAVHRAAADQVGPQQVTWNLHKRSFWDPPPCQVSLRPNGDIVGYNYKKGPRGNHFKHIVDNYVQGGFFLLFRVKNDLLVLQLFLFYSFLGRNSSETSQRAVT